MNFRHTIKKLQEKPYEIKVRILWGTTLVAGILLLVLWIVSLKATVAGLNEQPQTLEQTPETSVHYIRMERVEIGNDVTKIFFAVKNDSDDILNFSLLNDISLSLNSSNLTPAKLLNRQNKPFVNKILSHSEQFGILEFNQKLQGEGQTTFEQLFFEARPEMIFKETVKVDFAKLNKEQEIRN